MCGALAAGAASAKAANYYWDADGTPLVNATNNFAIGGSGTWDTSSLLWWDAASANLAWPNSFGDSAYFAGNAGLVTLTSGVQVGNLVFNTANYNITSLGAGVLTLGDAATADSGHIQVDVSGTTTISAPIAGTAGLTLSSSTTGTLALTGANTFSGGVKVASGTLSISRDINLGDAANGISFTGTTGTLTLTGPLAMNRDLALGDAAITLNVLGNFSDAGAFSGSSASSLKIVGSSMTSLNHSADFAGTIWEQTGTLNIGQLHDAEGDGNIQLGNGGSSATLLFGNGAYGPVTLNHRKIEMMGTTGSATIENASSVATNGVTINSDLLITGAGVKTLTLTGVNAGTNTFAGAIADGASPLNFTKSGTGLWVLSNAANTYTGTTLVNQGTLRVTGGGGGMGSGASTFTFGGSNGQVLELRNDQSDTYRSMSANGANNSFFATIFADRAIGGSGTDKIVSFDTIAQKNSTAQLGLQADHGYGITIETLVAIGSNGNLTLNNLIGAPGYAVAGYTPGIVRVNSLVMDATATGAGTYNLSGFGEYAVSNIESDAARPLTVVKNGIGFVTLGGDNSNWNGTYTNSAGTTRVVLADGDLVPTFGAANVTLTGGLLELRSNSSVDFTGRTFTHGNGTLVFAPEIGSNTTDKTLALATVPSGAGTLFFDTNHRYNVTFTAPPSTTGTTNYNNAGTGLVTFAGLNGNGQTVNFNGFGNVNVTGEIAAATNTNLGKSSQGVLTLSGTNTIGNVNFTGGVLRIASATALGGTGAITINGNGPTNSGLDFRISASADFSNHNMARNYAGIINVDRPADDTTATGNLITIGGGMSLQDNGWSTAFTGAHGYSLKIGVEGGLATKMGTSSGNISYVIWNYLPTGSQAEFASGVTFVNAASTTNFQVAGPGDYLFSGPLTFTAGSTSSSFTKNGTGVATLSNATNNTTFNAAQAIFALSNGVTRVTDGGALGGALTTVNQSGGLLDLRSDTGMTLQPKITLTNTSVINVDRAVGGTGTGGTHTLGDLSASGTNSFTLYATGGGNAYNLRTGTVTLGNTSNTTFVNNMSAGSRLTIPNIVGGASPLPVTFSGTGSTFISAGESVSNIGTITKNGTGTLTFTPPTNDFFVSNSVGGLVINGGRVVVDYTDGMEFSPAALGSSATLNLAGGAFEAIGSTSSNSFISLNAVTLSAGQGRIIVTPQTGFTTRLNLGSLTSTANGGSLLVFAPEGSDVSFGNVINPNGRAVFTADGTTFEWLATSGDFNNPGAFDGYTDLVTTPAGTDNNNSIVTGDKTLAVARTTSTLKIVTSGAGQGMALSGSGILTLSTGGLLFTGTDDYTISGLNGTANGLKSGLGGNADFIVSNYGTGVLTIATPILDAAGTDSFTKAGPGTVMLGNEAVADINRYNGTTNVNDGVLKLVNATRLGQSVNQQLLMNGGTLDLHGNSIGVGNFTGGADATVDNTAAGAVTLTIGNNNQGGTYNGIIKNTGGALSITKVGTSTITLSDLLIGGSNLFTGDLTLAGTGAIQLATLADAANSHVNFTAAAAGGNLIYIGNTNLVLENRDIVLTGNGITGTITSNGTVGANGLAGILTINSNFTPGASDANDTLTLAGSSGIVQTAWVNTFGGVIADPEGAKTALNVTTSGSWQLTGHNTFTGGIRMAGSGSLRFTDPAATNGNTITMVNGTIEFRSDASQQFNTPINWTTNNAVIIVDRAVDGSGYDQVMTLGGIEQNVALKNLYFRNGSWNGNGMTASNVITQYGARVPALNLNTGATSTIFNDLGTQGTATFVQPPATGFAGVPGALTIDQINLTAGVEGVHALTLTSDGNVGGVTIINGDITQVDGTNSLALTLSGGGQGFYILANQTAATNFTGGLTITGSNPAYTVVRATSPYSFGPSTNPMTWKRGTIELRSDESINYGHNITTDGTDQFNLYIGEAINGTGGYGKTFTFGTLTQSSSTTGKAVNIFGVAGSANASGDHVVFAGAHSNTFGLNGSNQGYYGSVIVNNLLLPSTVTVGTGAGSVALTTDLQVGTAFQSFGGAGVTIVTGAIMDNPAGGKLGVAYNAGGGYLTLDTTPETNYSGGLVIMNGTVRVINQYGLGAASNVVTMGQASYINTSNQVVAAGGNGILEIRSDVDVSYPNPISLLYNGNVYVGQLPGGTGTTGGQDRTIGLGTISTIANSGRTMTFAGVNGSTNNNGYSIEVAGIVVDQAATTFNNNLSLPGTLTIGSLSSTSSSGTNLVTFGGIGNTRITGPITDGAGAKTQVAFSGSGNSVLNLDSPDSNFSGGLTVPGSGSSLRVNNTTGISDFSIRATSQLGAPENLITIKGTLDFRTDVDVKYANAMVNDGAADAFISADRLTASGPGRTLTLTGGLTLNTTQRYLYIGGYNGYNVNLAGGYQTNITNAGTDSRIRNFGSGTVTIGGLSSGSNNNQTFVFDSIVSQSNTTGSNNLTVINGNITQGVGVLSLNQLNGVLDLTAVNKNAPANAYSGAVTIGSGTVIVSDGVNFGTGGAVTLAGNTTMQVRADANAVFGQTFTISSGVIFDLASVSGAQTNKLISLGALQPPSVSAATYTFNGRDGYAASVGTFKLNAGTGQTTTLVANAPLTLGAVVNPMTGFNSSNFDTLVLDGTADGVITGSIADAVGGSIAAGGTTRIQKNGVNTWTLAGLNGTYTGITTINAGTLALGADNAIGGNSPVTINASVAGITATLDLDGHNQTLLGTATSAALTLSGSTNSTPRIRLGDGTLTLMNSVAALLFTSGRTATISADGGTGAVALGNANAIFNITRVSTNIVSDTNAYGADVIISAPVIEEGTTGGITKLGSGYLALSSTGSMLNGALDIQAGTLGVGVLPDNSNLLKLGTGGTSAFLEYLGTVPVTLDTRMLTLAGTSGGGGIGNSGPSTSGTVTVNTQMAVTGSGNKTFTFSGTNTGDNRFNSQIADVSGTFSVSKIGTGTWTLTSNNTYSGQTIVDGGTLRLLNNTTVPASATGGGFTVGNSTNSRAALVFENANVTANITGGAMRVAAGTGSVGVVTQTGGSFLNNAASASNEFVIGNGSGSFGTYNLNGGGTVAGAQMEIGNSNSIGILNITDGSFSPTTPVSSSRYVIVSRFGNSVGQVNLIGTAGQTATLTGGVNSTGVSLGWTDTASNNRAEVNIGQGGVLNGGGAADGIALRSNGTNNVGIVNLLSGGTANIGFIGVISGTMDGVINLNGGTLRATQNNAAFFGAGMSSYLYAGGATLDSNGFNITIPTPLLAPTGNGLASVGFGAGGEGYLTAPYVQITDPTGFGATAIATIDASGKITGVTITNPGVGYTNPTVTFVGGGGTVIPTATVATAANLATGGLIKVGEGNVTLLGDNTFTGGLTINGGSLTLAGDNSTVGDTMITSGNLYLTPTATYRGTITNLNGVLAIQQSEGDYTVVSYGGLVTASSLNGTFVDAGIQAMGSAINSHGVVALNTTNSGIDSYLGTDVYLGAVGDRQYIGTTLAAGLGNTYRFGGGAGYNGGGATIGGSGGYLQIMNTVAVGANQVIIGDDGSYHGGEGLIGGQSTVEFVAPQTFTGALTLKGGTLVFSNDNQLGAQATAAGSLVFDGGILSYTPGNTADVSNRAVIASSATVAVPAGNTVVFATPIGNSAGASGGLNKVGAGTLSLAAAEAYTGATTVSSGTLKLDFAAPGAPGTDIIKPTTALVLNGGNLNLNGLSTSNTVSQSVASTTFSSGASTITPTFDAAPGAAGFLTFNLGVLNRASGATGNIVVGTGSSSPSTVALIPATMGTPNSLVTDAHGSAYLTFGTSATAVSDFAVYDNAQGATIVRAPAAGFYTPFAASSTVTGDSFTNADLVSTGTTAAGAVTLGTVRFANSGVHTLTIGASATDTLSTGGILIGNTVGNNLTTIGGLGKLTGPVDGDLIVHNWNPGWPSGSNQYTLISAGITNNAANTAGVATGVTYSGATGSMIWAQAANTYTGVTTTNGVQLFIASTIQPNAASQFGNASSDPANILVNGGGFSSNNTTNPVTLNRLFTIGLNGATFYALNSGPLVLSGNFNGSSDIAFAGYGPRTVTFDGSGTGLSNLALNLGDQGGSTSVVKNGSGLWTMTPTTANSYTGTTTINQGVLRITTNSLPGGLGFGFDGSTTSTANAVNTGGGNLVFNGAGSNNAILELTPGSGDFLRPLGTGIDQVQFTGNGGFSASGGDRTVNFGGASTPETIVWGSTPSFVPTGRTFFLGSAFSSGTVMLLNPIDYNGATRAIQVDNGTAAIDAVLEGGVFSSGAPVAFTKSGGGALLLKSADASITGLTFSNTNQGRVLFATEAAIPGAAGRTVTVTAGSEVALLGVLDPAPLLSRIATSSAGAIQLDAAMTTPTNTADLVIDFSEQTGLSLGAVTMNGTPAYFSGTLIPNGSTYRLGSSGTLPGGTAIPVASGGTGVLGDYLVLNRTRTLSGDASRLITANNTNGGATTVIITNSNDYGGETPGATATTLIGGSPGRDGATALVLANDAAFGAGNIAAATSGVDRFTYASLFGDHTLSNNLDASLATTYFLSANSGSELLPQSAGLGAMTFAGTVTLSIGSSSQIYGRSSTAPIIFTGDLKRTAANNLQITNQAFVEFLGAKSFTTGLTLADNTSLVIDGDSSLGIAPAAPTNNLVLGGSADAIVRPNIWLQAGSGAEALDANRKVVLVAGKSVVFRVDTADSLAIQGDIGLSAAGTMNFIKQGGGRLSLGGAFTGASTNFDIRSGTLALDYSNFAEGVVNSGAQVINSTPSLVLGTTGFSVGAGANGLVVVTKALVTGVAPSFSGTTFVAKPVAVGFDSAGGGTGTLNLGTLTRTVTGSSVAFTVPAGNSILTSSGSSNTLLTDGGGNAYAIFTGTQGATGTDWAAKSSTGTIVAGSSIGGFYTANTAATLTGNADLSGPALTTLAGPATVTSLRFGTAGAYTIDTSATAANILTVGGILVTSEVGANLSTIAGTAGPLRGTGGALKELIIFQNNTAGDLLISAPIVDNAGGTVLTKAGPGKLILDNNTNSFSGVVFFNEGTVEVAAIANGGSSQPLGKVSNSTGGFIFNGGSLRYNSATAGVTDHGATFNSVSGIDVADAALTLTSGSSSLVGSAAMPGALQKLGAGVLNLNGSSHNTNLSVEVVSGMVNLAKTGTANAVQQLNGASLIIDDGGTAVLTGTGADQIADTSSVLVKAGGTFDLNGHNEGFDGLAGLGNGVVTSATAATLTLGTNHGVVIGANTVGAALAGVGATGLNSFAGTITGELAVTKTGAGTQILSGSSTYSGGTLISSGVLKAAAANVLPSGAGKGDLTLANAVIGGIDAAGVFDLGGYDQKINGLNAAVGSTAYITNNLPTGVSSMTSTLVVGYGDASGNYGGILQDGFTVTTGSVSATGARGVLALTKVGSGTQTLSGANTYTGPTRVSGGGLVFASASPKANALTIDSGAEAELSVSLNGEGTKVLTTTALSLGGTAVLDLTNNALVVDYVAGNTALTGIEAAVVSGFHGGDWSGPGINTSTAASATVGGVFGLTGLGVSESSFVKLAPDGTFLGRPVDDSSVIVRYTLTGDANLDGILDLDDYTRIDTAFSMGSSPITGIHWSNGDFNYDGVINFYDYALIDTAWAFNNAPGSNSDIIAQHRAQFGEAYSLQMEALAANAIPEPGSMAMLAAGGLLLGLRRRRRS